MGKKYKNILCCLSLNFSSCNMRCYWRGNWNQGAGLDLTRKVVGWGAGNNFDLFTAFCSAMSFVTGCTVESGVNIPRAVGFGLFSLRLPQTLFGRDYLSLTTGSSPASLQEGRRTVYLSSWEKCTQKQTCQCHWVPRPSIGYKITAACSIEPIRGFPFNKLLLFFY